jgi:hypothetical protein
MVSAQSAFLSMLIQNLMAQKPGLRAEAKEASAEIHQREWHWPNFSQK